MPFDHVLRELYPAPAPRGFPLAWLTAHLYARLPVGQRVMRAALAERGVQP